MAAVHICYSQFTNDMQRFSMNFSKSTKATVLQRCRRYAYRNCEIWVESVFLVHIWLVFIWYMPIASYANIQAPNLMRMLLFVMVVVNISSNWPREAHISRINVESQVKVTIKVIKCKKIKCHQW